MLGYSNPPIFDPETRDSDFLLSSAVPGVVTGFLCPAIISYEPHVNEHETTKLRIERSTKGK